MCSELIVSHQTEDESEEAIGLAVSLDRIVAFSKFVSVACSDISPHISILHRVLDLSQWNLAVQLADLQELVVQGGLSDRVSPLHPMAPQLPISSCAPGGVFTTDYF